MTSDPPLSNWLEIGKVVGSQGLKGELRVYPESDFPERFEEPGQRWLLKPGAANPEPIELLKGRYVQGKGLYIVQLAGVDDRTQAEALRGGRLFVAANDRPALEEDEFHVLDLIGLSVFLQSDQTRIGEVVDVISAGNDLLEVQLVQSSAEEGQEKDRKPAAKALIPFVKAIVPIVDLEQKRIEIIPPIGLLEL